MTDQNYAELRYNDLKSLAKERELETSGTKEDLLARLEAADRGATPDESAQPAAGAADNVAPETPAEPEVHTNAQDVAQVHRDRAMRQKEYFDAQNKVQILIPFDAGEKPETAKDIPFHCSVNGYRYDIPRGTMVEVPEGIAQIVRERLESEGRIGRDQLVEADPNRAAALQG